MSLAAVLAVPGERFAALPAGEVCPAPRLHAVAASLPIAGQALVAHPDGPLLGVADGNRTAIFPGITTRLDGRDWALSVKGVGARAAMYGESPLDLHHAIDEGLGARWFAAEAWFGEAPWGAQGDSGAHDALALSDAAGGCSLAGFHICPVVEVVELPEEVLAGARDRWWYRRYRGPFLQEHRLVPSDVRLYHGSDRTLASDPDGVLDAFGVHAAEDFDAFVDTLLRTGVAALTLFARSQREALDGPEGLVYLHVWLDKDGVVAPDGTICFADLEGLDWVAAPRRGGFTQVVRRQFDENAYELLYVLDAVLRAGERRLGRPRTVRERRADAAARLDLALLQDPFVTCEVTAEAADLVVRSPLVPGPPVRLRAIDLS